MTIATALCASLLCVDVCAASKDRTTSIVACNLKAIGAAERPHYNDLMKRLRAATRGRSELPDGYALKLDGKAINLREVAEWISLERRCCPFLTFQLSPSGDKADSVLKLSGPEGVKALLQTEFPAH